MELSSQTGQFYKGSLQKGDVLESEASIVIIGDVCHGARVIAKGNVIVLGVLNGTVHAGAAGGNAVIVAFDMAPTQLRIADYCTRAEEKESGSAGDLSLFQWKKTVWLSGQLKRVS